MSNLIQGKQINVELTGSFSGSFTGILQGTSSWSENTVSSSFATTASYLLTSPVFTGSFTPTSSFNYFTSSYNTGSFRGDLIGTSSWSGNSVSSSFATTASYLSGNFTLDRVSNISASSAQNYNILIFSTSSLLWESKNPFSEFAANPIKYGEHVNVPTFGSLSHNNVEGVTMVFNGPVARTWADTNVVTRTQRMGLAGGTTGTVGGQFRQITQYMSRNGGFSITSGFNMAENANDTAIRFFMGIRNSIGTWSNVEPDTLINLIGVCRLSTSDNLQLLHNDGTGTATTIDLGSNFPANTVSTDKYVFFIETVPTGVYFKIERVGTDFIYEKIITTNLPASDLGMVLGGYIVDTSGANTPTGFDWHGSYVKVG
ncbi:MAG TPA: hypothetical protein PKC87_01940 [Candidatus Absconditabacterales bacterium]|nr:hypothetical protein [Candidatus Absconditabacterales bacterium]